ncbi:hypothetical protein [Mycobacterium sp. DL99]|uniref:hypothetical protein n=1 Tax=Mycobacterium sp. DL99 TaxID=2528957 RepID=UPI001080F1DA|nr:hypothetical protein [Mycobacterium sp. DL99]
MNATEDQSEPLGEHVDTLDAIQRGAVLNILSAADEVLATKQLAERQTRALNAVRTLHRPTNPADPRWAYCRHCGIDSTYPCATVRAIDEAGA